MTGMTVHHRPASPRTNWLADKGVDTFTIRFGDSDLDDHAAFLQFLAFPRSGVITPACEWEFIPSTATIRIYRKGITGRPRLVCQIKRNSIKATLDRLSRPAPGRMYASAGILLTNFSNSTNDD